MSKPIQIYIDSSSDVDLTSGSYDNSFINSQSVIMMGNSSTISNDVTVTLPLYSNLPTGNCTIYYLFNQQAPSGKNVIFQNPSGMGSFSLTLYPGQVGIIGILAQTYIKF